MVLKRRFFKAMESVLCENMNTVCIDVVLLQYSIGLKVMIRIGSRLSSAKQCVDLATY